MIFKDANDNDMSVCQAPIQNLKKKLKKKSRKDDIKICLTKLVYKISPHEAFRRKWSHILSELRWSQLYYSIMQMCDA